jgi:hypothetical protein
MTGSRHFVLLALVLALTTSGCSWFKKKKPPTVAQQAQAPTIAAPQPAAAAPAETQPVAPPADTKPAETAAQKPKPKPKPVPRRVVPAPKPVEQASAAPPPKIVIQEGGAGQNTISTAMPHDEVTDSKRTTQQLLEATDTNLRGLTRPLNADEKAMLEQIRAYQQQARTANQDGDVTRAHNLALKAHLLSDELVKR